MNPNLFIIVGIIILFSPVLFDWAYRIIDRLTPHSTSTLCKYVDIIHTYGIDSDVADAFIRENSDDEDFVRRAHILKKLMKEFK